MVYSHEILANWGLFMSRGSNKNKAGLANAFRKLFRFLFGFASMLLLCGFVAFLLHISRATPPAPMSKADGIVVLTGKGGGRLAAGAQLLKDGYGERLLISGVNPAIDEKQNARLIRTE